MNKNGKRPIVFSLRAADPVDRDQQIDLPCGKCIGCRLERSRQWALRCVHEASLYDRNVFITLTYSDEELPPGGTLVKRDFQLFMKRLRKKFGEGIRYYMCGEYGEKYSRPHFHACLFNCDFPDRRLVGSRNGFNYFDSEILSELWGKGLCRIGDVTFESAAYVARYVTKKMVAPSTAKLDSIGDSLDPETLRKLRAARAAVDRHYGGRLPEYTQMSKQDGGIGKGFFEKFQGDMYPRDYVVFEGKQLKPPKYYDSLFELQQPSVMDLLKMRRRSSVYKWASELTWDRLRVRERFQEVKFEQLKRGYENG